MMIVTGTQMRVTRAETIVVVVVDSRGGSVVYVVGSVGITSCRECVAITSTTTTATTTTTTFTPCNVGGRVGYTSCCNVDSSPYQTQ